MLTVRVDTLRAWLEAGKAVTILDVRPAAAYAVWSIPGSLHIDAYESLKAGQTTILAELALPADRPVVTVCEAGKVSKVAAALLAARGLEAYSLEGGMRAWSLAWNTACLSLSLAEGEEAQIIQVRRTGKGCLSYLIGDGVAALVLDPALDPQVYLTLAAERGWRIVAVLETHIHADHLSRARALAQQSQAGLLLPAQQRVAFPCTPVSDSETIVVGRLRLRAIHTPGHTPESTCYLLVGGSGETSAPAVLFSGDTLFPEGCGRPDLDADPDEVRRRAEALYTSLRRLLRLPRQTRLLAAHSTRPLPFDGQPVMTTLAALQQRLGELPASPMTFVTQLLSALPAPPSHYQEIIQANEMGRWPALPVEELEAGANRCAVIL
jgi:glyoxylase-like metal-dependent hydrolase (beta-lactamase superfamily II)/rhodanese-related sulfurtransferase